MKEGVYGKVDLPSHNMTLLEQCRIASKRRRLFARNEGMRSRTGGILTHVYFMLTQHDSIHYSHYSRQ